MGDHFHKGEIMRSKSLRRIVASLSLALGLTVLLTPAAHAAAPRAARTHASHAAVQPAGNLLTTFWNHLVAMATGTQPAGEPTGTSTTTTSNGDVGATADPNGLRRVL
jgi:hypothetical protein